MEENFLEKFREDVQKTIKELKIVLFLCKKLNQGSSFHQMEKTFNSLKERSKKIKFPPLDLDEKLKKIYSYIENSRFEFAKQLEEELKQKGFTLRGQLPVLYTKFYTLRFNFVKNTTEISMGGEVIKRCKINPKEVVKNITRIHKNLEKESINYKELGVKLYNLWERWEEKRVPIIEGLKEISMCIQGKQFWQNPTKERFKEYGRVKFGYDLYKIKKLNLDTIKNKKLTLVLSTFDATRDKNNYVWIPINEEGEGSCYSYITFE